MKRWLLALLLLPSLALAEGPKYGHSDPNDAQEFQNLYNDLRKLFNKTIPTINAGTVNASTITVSSATIADAAIAKEVVQVSTINALSMNAHKITGLANGTAATDAAAFGQIATPFLLSAPVFSSSSVKTSNASTTYVAAGPSATITPQSSSSRFIVCTSGELLNSNEAVSNAQLTIFRNSTDLDVTGNGMTRPDSSTFLTRYTSICLGDSPATASAVTYQVYIKRQQGTSTISYTADSGGKSSMAFIVVLEVK